MKRTERRHLKENELLHLTQSARGLLDGGTRNLAAIGGVVVVLLGVGGYFLWQRSVDNRAGAKLAQALVLDEARIGAAPEAGRPDAGGLSFPTERARQEAQVVKFKETADAYASTDAGLFARYREASIYMALGKPQEALAAYQQVVDRGGQSLYARMAKLGVAEAQAQTGQFDQAIATFKDLSQQKDGPIPVDGILMRLGRTYLDAGKASDAQQTFNRIVEEFPDSPFSADARRELDQLKKA